MYLIELSVTIFTCYLPISGNLMSLSSLKFTLLVDNNAPDELEKEHGFSVWIEVEGRRILFDTGQLGALQVNAKRLGINLEDAEMLVLSHGHYDHTGTIPEFLAVNPNAQIYMADNAKIDRWSNKPGTEPRSIGIPERSRQALLALPAERITEITSPYYLMPGVGLTGPVPRISAFEDTGGPFYLDNESKADDLIEDDQSMWFETDEGLIILLGCCHSGLVNTINYIRSISGKDKVRGIIGGMHLVNADDKRLNYTFDAFKSWQPEFLVPCHCTGEGPTINMVNVIGEEIVKPGQAGMVIQG